MLCPHRAAAKAQRESRSAIAAAQQPDTLIDLGHAPHLSHLPSPFVLKAGALRVVLALVLRRIAVVGTVFRRWRGGRGFAGACRPSNAHEDGRPVALKTDLAFRNGPAS